MLVVPHLRSFGVGGEARIATKLQSLSARSSKNLWWAGSWIS